VQEYGHYSTPEELAQVEECSVCFETPYRPVTLDCQHVFCEGCILEWVDREKSCPLCRCTIRLSDSTGSQGVCGEWRNLSWLASQPQAFSGGRLF
jgi:hypothetical protein